MNVMTECPTCKSQKVVAGRLIDYNSDGWPPIGFKPGVRKWYQLDWTVGVELKPEAFACPDCGLVWSSVPYPALLRELVQRHTKGE